MWQRAATLRSTASRFRRRGLPAAPANRQEVLMQVLYTRCAGLDVHKDTIVACVRCVSPPMHQEVRSFGSTTTELLALADWLAEHGCTHVGDGGHRRVLEAGLARARR